MPRDELQKTLRIGVVQMTSTNRHDGNIAFVQDAAEKAASEGCGMIALPEVAGMMNRRIEADRDLIRDESSDPFISACRKIAAQHEIWIHTGSTPIVRAGDARFLNHSNLIDPTGRIVASYDKVHLFDMYPEEGTPILESRRYAPGNYSVLADTPWGPLGMSICYDLRFPQFFRDYARDGAVMLFVPSAFTVPTGRAHWEILLRARAIENGAYVVAAAQVGTHDDGRETWGHSLVVAPSGEVLLDMEDRLGLAVVDLDMDAVQRARTAIPSLAHGRTYSRLPERNLA